MSVALLILYRWSHIVSGRVIKMCTDLKRSATSSSSSNWVAVNSTLIFKAWKWGTLDSQHSLMSLHPTPTSWSLCPTAVYVSGYCIWSGCTIVFLWTSAILLCTYWCEDSGAGLLGVCHWPDVPPPFHSQEWSISNFSCSLTITIAPHSMENLAFHSSLRWMMAILPILTTSLIHSLWENVLFEP